MPEVKRDGWQESATQQVWKRIDPELYNVVKRYDERG